MDISKEDVKRYHIENICSNKKDVELLRAKKWGYGKVLSDVNDINISDAIREWRDNEVMLYPMEFIYLINFEYLSTSIKYRNRNRETSIHSWWEDDETGKRLMGYEKWDFLLNSIKQHGWDWEQPASIIIRKRRRVKIKNGHHRLGVAKELNLECVPVCFLYR